LETTATTSTRRTRARCSSAPTQGATSDSATYGIAPRTPHSTYESENPWQLRSHGAGCSGSVRARGDGGGDGGGNGDCPRRSCRAGASALRSTSARRFRALAPRMLGASGESCGLARSWFSTPGSAPESKLVSRFTAKIRANSRSCVQICPPML
jgi:hypothetical protein